MKEQAGYYAVIFSSQLNPASAGYDEMSDKMVSLAKEQPGFLSFESVRSVNGQGITVSYWKSFEDIQRWKKNELHLEAQRLGKQKWYQSFKVRICKVEIEYEKHS